MELQKLGKNGGLDFTSTTFSLNQIRLIYHFTDPNWKD